MIDMNCDRCGTVLVGGTNAYLKARFDTQNAVELRAEVLRLKAELDSVRSRLRLDDTVNNRLSESVRVLMAERDALKAELDELRAALDAEAEKACPMCAALSADLTARIDEHDAAKAECEQLRAEALVLRPPGTETLREIELKRDNDRLRGWLNACNHQLREAKQATPEAEIRAVNTRKPYCTRCGGPLDHSCPTCAISPDYSSLMHSSDAFREWLAAIPPWACLRSSEHPLVWWLRSCGDEQATLTDFRKRYRANGIGAPLPEWALHLVCKGGHGDLSWTAEEWVEWLDASEDAREAADASVACRWCLRPRGAKAITLRDGRQVCLECWGRWKNMQVEYLRAGCFAGLD